MLEKLLLPDVEPPGFVLERIIGGAFAQMASRFVQDFSRHALPSENRIIRRDDRTRLAARILG